MLFVLTGNIQIGKSRWLNRLVERLEDAGVECFGVVTPGIWEAFTENGEKCYRKLGINAVLLPQKDTEVLGMKVEPAESPESLASRTQSASADLAWSISDAAIERVNKHFASSQAAAGLLVIDEVGRMELNHNQGFTEALSLLDAGPSGRYEHALIVVRSGLLEKAIERFSPAWGKPKIIHPTNENISLVHQTLLPS